MIFGTKDFFRATTFLTKNALKFSPKFWSLFFFFDELLQERRENKNVQKSSKISVTQKVGRNKGGRKQMQANADKRRQTQANAEAKTQANASKREQMWTNANKRLHPPLLRFLTPPFAIPLKKCQTYFSTLFDIFLKCKFSSLNLVKAFRRFLG